MAEAPVVLLGSAAAPWPVAGCSCRTCLAVPDDAPDEAPPLAATALRIGPLTVVGATISDSVPGSASAEPLVVAPGEAAERSGVRVVGLPAAGDGTALVLAGRGTGTVLWAPCPGGLPPETLDALTGADVTIAVLDAGTDGAGLAASLARLRQVGALAATCDTVAVGLDHATAPDRLAVRLRAWGARMAPDGALLGPGHTDPPPRPPRRTLVLGPTSSGKSAYAEALLAAEPAVDYLPTGPAPTPDDEDWAARVTAHRRRRPRWWRTLEGAAPARALTAGGPPLLLDSVGTWVSGALDRCGAWDDARGWEQLFEAEVDAVVGAWRQAGRRVVAVGEETGWGVVPTTPAGRRFRDALGTVNRRLAAESEQVLLVVGGRVVELTEGVHSV